MSIPSFPLAISPDDIDETALLAELKAWVEIESHTPDVAGVSAMMDRAEAYAKACGFHIERLPGKPGFGDVLIVRSGEPRETEAEKGVLVLAHLDTVHARGTLAGKLPYREEGNRIYGPGIYDMKSGALMTLAALKLAVASGNGPKRPVTILFAPDEETGSVSCRAIIEAEGRKARSVLVVEPARDGGRIVVARKGVAIYDIGIYGKPSHAGTHPQNGVSAIREAAKIILKLEALNDFERGVTVTVGQIEGGAGRNIIPAECHLKVDVRLPDAEAERDVLAFIDGLKPEDARIRLRISGGMNRPAFPRSAGGDALFAQARAVAKPLGIELEGMATGGGSDGNFTAAMGVATLDGLGADGAGAHTHEEYILKDSVRPRTALLANLILTLD
ncbi:M20 family metallopeptidase [Rhizobiaceae bacterium BDR2-2]|uniref:M20 family metallopeptidase n=1 Tax=Ectorhizobium quercum TaxID=2965071 RepID=A0AAE3SW13_9HYPH|nr:M20 family metallopeptidase [Ectorhizobium quercum]MCX8998258.1 M20 family metallopeptidase [Ectorhizobium quercum]